MASWATAEQHGPDLVRRLLAEGWPKDVLINVNFPPVPPEEVTGVRYCRVGRRDADIEVIQGKDPNGHPYSWIGDFANDATSERDTDLSAVAEGKIAVSPLHLDMTHKSTLKRLKAALA